MPVTTYLDENTPMVSPVCYARFSCKGVDCRNTCCQRWRIDISRTDYNRVRNLCDRSKNLPDGSEVFQRKPRQQATDENYAKIKLNENGYCPLLTDDGLCGLQLELGYPILPTICKKYPRLMYLIDERECVRALDLSCERVLEQLLEESTEPLRFIQEKLPSGQEIQRDVNTDMKDYCSDIRNLCIWIVQNRTYPLDDRLILLGIALRELDKIQRHGTLELIPDWFRRHMVFTKDCGMADTLREVPGNSERFVHNNLRFYAMQARSRSSLHALFQRIAATIEFSVEDGVNIFQSEAYTRACTKFAERFPKIDNFFENCLSLLILHWTFPLGKEGGVWKAYTRLCSVYSLMRFTAVTSIPQNSEDLIDNLVLLFRSSTSNNVFDRLSCDQLELTESDTLAHIAILIRG